MEQRERSGERVRRVARAVALAIALVVASLLPTQPAVAASPSFEQDQRVVGLTLANDTSTFAPDNALGGAFGATALSQVNSGLAASVKDGSQSWLLEMPGLTDLSGTDQDSFLVGMVDGQAYGTVGNPTTYDGTSDVDWWYGRDPSDVDGSAAGDALHQLPAGFTDGKLVAGPGEVRLHAAVFGWGEMHLVEARLQAVSGASTPLLRSENGLPPGHLASEGLPAGLTSFGTMSTGELTGAWVARSLANTPIPQSLTGSSCDNRYTIANSALDLVVGGCRFVNFPQTTPTQPDYPEGEYRFTTDSQSHAVTGCTHQAVSTPLGECLDAAAYSVRFEFTTDRVISRRPCAPGGYSSDGLAPCSQAQAGFFVPGYGATSQTPCPEGWTSDPGASDCPIDIGPPTLADLVPAEGAAVSGTGEPVSVTASDTGTGVAAVEFRVDGVTVQTDATAPYGFSWDTTGFGNGAHTLSAVATDVAGNVSNVLAHSVTVGNVVPDVPSAPPAPTAVAGNGQVTVAWSPPADLGSGTFTRYEVATDDDVVRCTTTVESDRTCSATGLANGTGYRFRVRAVTTVGNGAWSPPSAAVTPDGTVPTAALTAPSAAFQLAGTAVVKWTGSDDGSGLGGFRVRFRRAPYDDGYGAWTYPAAWQALDASTRQLTAPLTAGSTDCFSVRAVDHAGNQSPWSAQRCVAQPLDDRSLTAATRGWVRGTGSAYFRHTFTRATVAGKRLTRSDAQLSRLALVATRCPRCGSVKVMVGSTRIAVVSLRGSATRNRQLIVLPAFRYRTGKVSLVVTTSHRPVIVDGLGISRS